MFSSCTTSAQPPSHLRAGDVSSTHPGPSPTSKPLRAEDPGDACIDGVSPGESLRSPGTRQQQHQHHHHHHHFIGGISHANDIIIPSSSLAGQPRVRLVTRKRGDDYIVEHQVITSAETESSTFNPDKLGDNASRPRNYNRGLRSKAAIAERTSKRSIKRCLAR